MELPLGSRRLFPHSDPDPAAHRPYLIGRLLEDGDSDDLSALMRAVPEDDLRRWLARRGGRQLSRRSRLFWSLVLDVPKPERMRQAPAAEALWPL